MASYEFKTWQTIDLPVVSDDTYFLILDHRVLEDNNPMDETDGIIFTGKIVDGYNLKNLQEILDQYIKPQTLIFSGGTQEDANMHKVFWIYYSQDGWASWSYDSIVMVYDWSFGINTPNTWLSDPIVNLLDCRQWFLFSSKAATPDISTNITAKLENTEIGYYTMSGYTYYNFVSDLSSLVYPAEFDYEFSYDFFVDGTRPIAGTFNNITVGTSAVRKNYQVTLTCNRYCIYYINKFGGWDSMLFRGKELKTDNIERLSYKQNYRAMSNDFGQIDYLTKINESWSLNTSYLTDEQSSKMNHLLETNRAFLHDLVDNKIYPINVTNSTCELKTYKNQGRKMAVYTIEVKSSQNKYRIN